MTDIEAIAVLRRFAPNLRPLGETVLAPGRLYRSSALTGLDAEGWAAVTALGVRTLIDLRGPEETAAMPVDPPPPIDLVPIPFPAQDESRFDGPTAADESTVARIGVAYRNIVVGEGAAIAHVLRTLLRPEALPAIIFCTVGKDRTGIVAALLLAAIGADRDEVHRDYAATNTALTGAARAHILGLVARASTFAMPTGAVDAMLRADPAYIDAALDEAGPAAAYFARHGFKSEDIASLSAALGARN